MDINIYLDHMTQDKVLTKFSSHFVTFCQVRVNSVYGLYTVEVQILHHKSWVLPPKTMNPASRIR